MSARKMPGQIPLLESRPAWSSLADGIAHRLSEVKNN